MSSVWCHYKLPRPPQYSPWSVRRFGVKGVTATAITINITWLLLCLPLPTYYRRFPPLPSWLLDCGYRSGRLTADNDTSNVCRDSGFHNVDSLIYLKVIRIKVEACRLPTLYRLKYNITKFHILMIQPG